MLQIMFLMVVILLNKQQGSIQHIQLSRQKILLDLVQVQVIISHNQLLLLRQNQVLAKHIFEMHRT